MVNISQRPREVFNVIGKGSKKTVWNGVEITRSGNKYDVNKSFVYWCGCSSMTQEIRNAMRMIGLPEFAVPRLKTSIPEARSFIRANKLELQNPKMNGSVFAFLVSPIQKLEKDTITVEKDGEKKQKVTYKKVGDAIRYEAVDLASSAEFLKPKLINMLRGEYEFGQN